MSDRVSSSPGLEAAPPPPPPAGDQRLHTLDILRGLALLGMILVHFHQRTGLPVTGWEDLIPWGVWVLVEQKAWGVFAFLFGVGFAVLLRRLEARWAPVVPTYLRRLAALAVVGVVVEVGFGFHILLEYACWGVVLLLIRRWSTGALLATAVFAACARPVAAEAAALHAWWTGAGETVPAAGAALAEAVAAAARQDAYGPLLTARWALLLGQLPRDWPDLLPTVNLALFTLGLLAVRHGVLQEPKRHARLIGGWMAFGAVAWAAWWLALRHLAAAPMPGAGPLASGLGLVQEQWLCFSYIGAVVLLLAYRPRWIERLAPVGFAGRMALTNYVLQAALIDALASGYGLALRLRPVGYLAGAILLFAAQMAISSAWLARYRFGPLEWIWRAVTYARPEPIRLAVAPTDRIGPISPG